MEGNQLSFFVTYNENEAFISLSEYDTVEQLKIEIDNHLDIPVLDQLISGWNSEPESEDTILQVCAGSLNALTVKNRKTCDGGSKNVGGINSENYMDVDMDKNNKDLEIDATRRLRANLPEDTPLNIVDLSFKDAVSSLVTSEKKKALLLYLHNSEDPFSQQFLLYLHDDQVAEMLENNFLILGWDIEDQTNHSALKSALEAYLPLSIIPQLITTKIGAAVCLLVDNNEPFIFSCLKGNLSYQNFLDALRNLVTHLNNSDESPETASYPMEEQDQASKEREVEAIKSLKRKMPRNIGVTFRECSLDDAINFICTAPFDERKALLLYLHNSEQPFSKMFSDNLIKGELVATLNRNFLVLGWDVENPDYHGALSKALSHHVNLTLVADLVENKVAVALCILPISGTISLYHCLRGKTTLKETIKSLKEVENVFKEEIVKEIELKKMESEKSNKNDLGSEKLQGIWADMLGDRDYDRFEFDQHQFLKDKIGFAIKGPPEKETGYDSKTKARVEELYEVIKTQSDEIAEFKDQIEISFIYNCLEPLPDEKVKRNKKYPDYNPQTDVNPVPVFVLRKCRGSQDPCRIFVDDNGRVYGSWSNYLTKNKYPECEMIVPLNGRYQVENETVLLEKHLSPACQLDVKLLQVGDMVSMGVGLVSGAIFMAAAIPAITVAPPIIVGAAAAGLGAGIYAMGRSAYTLIDRSLHKESMSFANSEARGAYLNIVAGSLGFVGAGANMALSQLARSGANIGQGATYLVNTVGILNIGAGGASLVNSGYEVFDQWYNENQTPSALTILQLSTSVLFFGHAVYNFRGAQTIIDETQARVLKDYQDSLRSNRHRKTFNKLVKETLRTHGDGARGRAEVISAIRNIQNKDEVFAALTRNNRAMNRAGVRFSADGGQIHLDGIAVDMNEFIGLNKKQSETFLNNLSQQRSSQLNATNSGGGGGGGSNTTSSSNYSSSFKTAVKDILNDMHVDTSGANINQIVSLAAEILLFCGGDVQTKVVNAVHRAVSYVLCKLARPIAEELDQIIPKSMQFSEFLHVGISYFSRQVDDWEHRYQMYMRTKDDRYYHQLFEYVNPLYAKRVVTLFEFVVRNSYSGDTLVMGVVREIAGCITAWVTRVLFENEERKEETRRREIHSAGFRVKRVECKDCGGYYFSHV